MKTNLFGIRFAVVALLALGGTAHAAGNTSDGASCAAAVDPFANLSDITRRVIGSPVGTEVVRIADLVHPLIAPACEARISQLSPSIDASKSCSCIEDALAAEPPATVAHWAVDDAPAGGDASYDAFVADVEGRCLIAKTPEVPHRSWLSGALSDAEKAFTHAVHAIGALPGAALNAAGDAVRSLLVADGGPLIRASMDFAFDQGFGEDLCREKIGQAYPGANVAKACSCAHRQLAAVSDASLVNWATHPDRTSLQADPQFRAYEHRVELCAK